MSFLNPVKNSYIMQQQTALVFISIIYLSFIFKLQFMCASFIEHIYNTINLLPNTIFPHIVGNFKLCGDFQLQLRGTIK